MVQRYCKVRNGNNVSGTDRHSCPFYDDFDAILGTRAATQPVQLLQSAVNDQAEGMYMYVHACMHNDTLFIFTIHVILLQRMCLIRKALLLIFLQKILMIMVW